MNRAREQVVSIARGVLAGDVNPVLGAIEINRLLALIGVPQADPDREVFICIDSECQPLPFGTVRELWAADALAAKAGQIAHAERWALQVGEQALRNVVARFSQST